jgi:hypothetical protein
VFTITRHPIVAITGFQLRQEDIDTIEALADGEKPTPGASIAELTERRRRVAS